VSHSETPENITGDRYLHMSNNDENVHLGTSGKAEMEMGFFHLCGSGAHLHQCCC